MIFDSISVLNLKSSCWLRWRRRRYGLLTNTSMAMANACKLCIIPRSAGYELFAIDKRVPCSIVPPQRPSQNL